MRAIFLLNFFADKSEVRNAPEVKRSGFGQGSPLRQTSFSPVCEISDGGLRLTTCCVTAVWGFLYSQWVLCGRQDNLPPTPFIIWLWGSYIEPPVQ